MVGGLAMCRRGPTDHFLGPAFHRNGERPRAPCPVCAQENGEDQARELFSIRGFKSGEYDPAIPKFWFSAPPMQLDANGKEVEALRVRQFLPRPFLAC